MNLTSLARSVGLFRRPNSAKAIFASRLGATLTESIAAMVLTALLGTVGVVGISGLRAASLTRQAGDEALALNAAKMAYNARNRTAESTWTSQLNDSARFLLLVPYCDGLSGQTLSSYVPNGYSFALGTNVTDPVVVTIPGGTTLNYTSNY
jgi:type II secretory pathway pseudopilin PulG